MIKSMLNDYHNQMDQVLIVSVTDPAGLIIYVNDNFCHISGFSRKEIIGKSHKIISSGNHGKPFFSELWNTINKGEEWKGDIENKGKKKNAFWLDTTIIPIFDDEKNIKEFIAIQVDVTQRKEKENKLAEANKVAETLIKVKDSFLANVSHEIRTPMNAVIGFTELLDSTETSLDQKEYVRSIKIAGNHLLGIINDILDFTKIKSGKLVLDEHSFNVESSILFVGKILKPSASKKGVKLNLFLEPKLQFEVLGDFGRLQQILMNLVGNAIKFTERGKIDIAVNLAKQTRELYYIKFSVTDTGVGIHQENIKEIFNRFSQDRNYRENVGKGTGLGLSISNELVVLFGGKLKVESELNKGTKFYFVIPFRKSKILARTERSPKIKLPAVDRLIGKRVLLIEDNELNQLLVKRMLINEGVNLDIVGDGLKGIKSLSKINYDIILLDLQMPMLDGYEVTREIRESLKITTPIIAMTAHSLDGVKERCLKIGMNDYISKPFSKKLLVEKLLDHFVLRERFNKKYLLDELTKTKINDLGGGDLEFVIDMIQIFITSNEVNLRGMEPSIKDLDKEGISRCVHKLRNNFGMFALSLGVEITDKFDHLTTTDVSQLQASYEELREYWESILVQLEAHRVDLIAKQNQAINLR